MLRLNESNFIHNLETLKKANPATQMGIVLKANAYNHDIVKIAGISRDYAEWYLVSNTKEARLIAQLNLDKPILMLYTFEDSDLEILKDSPEIRFSIYSLQSLKLLLKYAKLMKVRIIIHLNIDTGMHCLGIENMAELEEVLEILEANQEFIKLEGVWTHLATADDLESQYYYEQISRFKTKLDLITSKEFVELGVIHYQNTAAFIRGNLPENSLEEFQIPIMARLGIGVYGYYPSNDIKKLANSNNLELKPALIWESEVVHIKELQEGDSISYNQTFVCEKDTVIAIIPLGYSDGYSRLLSNVGEVTIHKHKCRVLGRVRMNMFAVDITNLKDIKIGDVVRLLGPENSVDEIATQTQTINYEVITRIKGD